MGTLTFANIIFNKYTAIFGVVIAVSFTIWLGLNKIENLEKALEIESLNVIELKSELIQTNEIIESQKKNLLEQVDNILILETEKQNLKNDLQKQIEKRNRKDVNDIIVKKTKLTEITVNRFIKKKIEKYNNREGVK